MFTSWHHPTQKFQNMANWVCFGPLFFNLIGLIQLCDKKNLTFVDCWGKILLNSSWKTLLSLPQARLITFSKTCLINFISKVNSWQILYNIWKTFLFPFTCFNIQVVYSHGYWIRVVKVWSKIQDMNVIMFNPLLHNPSLNWTLRTIPFETTVAKVHKMLVTNMFLIFPFPLHSSIFILMLAFTLSIHTNLNHCHLVKK